MGGDLTTASSNTADDAINANLQHHRSDGKGTGSSTAFQPTDRCHASDLSWITHPVFPSILCALPGGVTHGLGTPTDPDCPICRDSLAAAPDDFSAGFSADMRRRVSGSVHKHISCGRMFHGWCLRQYVNESKERKETKCPICRGMMAEKPKRTTASGVRQRSIEVPELDRLIFEAYARTARGDFPLEGGVLNFLLTLVGFCVNARLSPTEMFRKWVQYGNSGGSFGRNSVRITEDDIVEDVELGIRVYASAVAMCMPLLLLLIVWL